jgi:hypothetical protein
MSDDTAPLRPLEDFQEASIYGDAPLPAEPPGFFDPAGAPASSARRKFTLEPFEQIKLPTGGEWLVKKAIPKTGTGVLYHFSLIRTCAPNRGALWT